MTDVGPTLPAGRFHGRILGSRDGPGFRLTEAAIEPARRLGRHSHELAFFSLLVGGAYQEDYGRRGRRTVAYRPFTVAFHPAGEPHLTEMCATGARVFNVEISQDWLASHGAQPPAPCADVSGGEITWLATRLYREYLDGLPGPPLSAEALVLEMVSQTRGRAARDPEACPRWFSRALDFLEAEYRGSLRISEVAATVGAHPTHLSRVFRRTVGLPIGDYVHRLRVRWASEELCRPGARLADVAADAGFADQSHMTRVFKRLTGASPAAFRSGLRLPPAG